MLNGTFPKGRSVNLCSSLPACRDTINNKPEMAWDVYCATIYNRNEEMNVVQLADWRQKTSMPIVRVKLFSLEKKQSYPKNCEIEIERIAKSFDQIKQLELHDSLYLLREALMGYQTLVYKFGAYDIFQTACGVNEKGQCRVWLSKDVSEVPYFKGPLLKPIDIITHIFKKLILMTKNSHREILRQLQIQIHQNQSITYGKLFSLIKDFAKKQKITIPSYIKRERTYRTSLKRGEGISEREICNQRQYKKWSAQKKLSLRSISPLLRQLKSCHSTEKPAAIKPKLNWKNACLNQSLDAQVSPSPSTPATPVTPWNVRGNSLFNRQIGSVVLDKTNELNKKPRYKAPLNKVSIKEFKIEDEELQEIENKQQSRKRLESPKTNHSNNSIWTTQMTDSSKDEINLTTKNSNSENLENSQKTSQRDQSPINLKVSKTYNFGGLITVPEIDPILHEKQKKEKKEKKEDLKKSFEDKELKWKEARENRLEARSKLIESFTSEKLNDNDDLQSNNDGYRSQFLDTVGNLDGFWGSRMINLFQESRCLKESLHCGEDVKAPQMEIKLEKLGKLGREIKTSCMPDM